MSQKTKWRKTPKWMVGFERKPIPIETNTSWELSRERDSIHDQPSTQFLAHGTETTKPVKRYEGELAERELAAQEEIAKKAKRVAPAYSKGAYQYITDTNNLSELGRKL